MLYLVSVWGGNVHEIEENDPRLAAARFAVRAIGPSDQDTLVHVQEGAALPAVVHRYIVRVLGLTETSQAAMRVTGLLEG